MMGRKSPVGIAVLCALVCSALSVASASAEQRAYTCTKSATTKEFSDAHCLSKGGSGYGHVLIPESATTVTITSEKTAEGTTAAAVSKLKSQLSGVPLEVQCKGLHGHGTLANAAASVTSEGVLTSTECTVTAPPGRGCVVVGGQITTNNISVTTAGQAANALRFTPGPGETRFFTLPIQGCEEEIPPSGNYPITGSFVASASGATATTTHAGITAQSTLRLGGIKTGLEGALTISIAEGSTPSVTAGEAITLT